MKTAGLLQALSLYALLVACATTSVDGVQGATIAVDDISKDVRRCYDRSLESYPAPTVCHGAGGPYVTGLPRGHNWTRGTRVLLSKPIAGVGETTVAVAWVVESHERAVTVNIIIGEPDQSLEGATARPKDPDHRVRFENFYGHMKSRDGKQLVLDIGQYDGVREGDFYEARDELMPDYPVGAVRVTRVNSMSADAEVIQETKAFGVFDEFVLSPRGTSIPVIQVGVVSAGTSDPETHQNHDLLLTKLDAVKAGSHPFGITVEQLRPARGQDPVAPTHDSIAASARAQHMGQVVWAEGVCTTDPCVRAWYAVVPESPKGILVPKPLFFPSTTGGSVDSDPSAVLGQLAHGAQAFDEASYHLRAWAADDSGNITTEARLQLAEAEQELGQFGRARIWLRPLGTVSDESQLLRYFHARGRGACAEANLLELENLQKSALKHVHKHPKLKEFNLRVLECKVDLGLAAGNLMEASRLIDEGAALAEELGNHRSISHFKTRKAELHERAGRFDEAQRLRQDAYDLAVSTDDRQAQAGYRLALAKNRAQAGDFTSAKDHAQTALGLFKVLQDDDGIVECLPVLVKIHRHLDGIEVARRFLDNEFRALKRRRLPRADFALRLAGTYLDLQQGDLLRASRDLKKLRGSISRQRRSDEEIQVLEMQAELFILMGQAQQARSTIDHYWQRARDLGRARDLARAYLIFSELSLQEGNWKSARNSAKEALKRYQLIHDQAGMAATEFILGEIEREFGKVPEAQQHYKAARESFQQVQDADGAQRADLGLAALGLWRQGSIQARQHLLRIDSHFKKVGNVQDLLRVRLQLEWAKFLYSRDRAASLQALRILRDEAKRKKFVAFHAEAQMLIACVHRTDSDHKIANQEFAVARKLYADIGRHTQSWPCEAGPEPHSGKALAAVR